METNEINRVICEWLDAIKLGEGCWIYNEQYFRPDFTNDRNQQKWIIDELKKRGWTIYIEIDPEFCEVELYKPNISYISRKESDEGNCLIECVLELIEKETPKLGINNSQNTEL